MAGIEHVDYGPSDMFGKTWLDRADAEQFGPRIRNGASDD
jgi:hypothetical protein